MNIALIEPSAEEIRRSRILEGATSAFLAYGFQRTTMDDIARAADISRPLLYLMFKNKTDIYRALAAAFMEEMLANARDVMAKGGPLEECLTKTIACALDEVDEIEASPHGAEILDMKNSLAGDIIADCRSEMARLITGAIDEAASRRGSKLAGRGTFARTLADMLLDSIDGMKLRQIPVSKQRACLAAYISIVDSAVRG